MKTFLLPVLILSMVASSVFAAEDEDEVHAETAISFTEKRFADDVAENPHFVMFFAPWCGHCKSLAPVWEELSVDYNNKDDEEKDALIGKVDCTVETVLCSNQDVTGYPTLKFFKSGVDSGVKYRGQRDISSLKKFIHQQITGEEEVLSQPEEATLEKSVYTLSEKSFSKHIQSGHHFIKFYAPWCGHCQKLAPIWEELGTAFEDDESVKISKLDCTQAQELCKENNVKGYPTLAFLKDGVIVESYKGARNLKDLKDFVMSMKEAAPKKASSTEEKEKVPTEDGETHSFVLKLNSDDFEETIKEGVTFVKFFAPWCGHCKRMAPTWDELAQKFSEHKIVKIAKVDCTYDDNKNRDLCNAQGVNGFPTLNIYEDGKKVTEYGGSRKIEELEAFVRKHSGIVLRDEL